MKPEQLPWRYRLRHRLASWIYGVDIDIYAEARFEQGERFGYAKAKREQVREQVKAFRKARQKDNESVVLLTERDYDQLSDAIKGEGENK